MSQMRNLINAVSLLEAEGPTHFEPTHFHLSNLSAIFGQNVAHNKLMLYQDGRFYWMKNGQITRWNGNVNNRGSANPASVDGIIKNGQLEKYPDDVTFAMAQQSSTLRMDPIQADPTKREIEHEAYWDSSKRGANGYNQSSYRGNYPFVQVMRNRKYTRIWLPNQESISQIKEIYPNAVIYRAGTEDSPQPLQPAQNPTVSGNTDAVSTAGVTMGQNQDSNGSVTRSVTRSERQLVDQHLGYTIEWNEQLEKYEIKNSDGTLASQSKFDTLEDARRATRSVATQQSQRDYERSQEILVELQQLLFKMSQPSVPLNNSYIFKSSITTSLLYERLTPDEARRMEELVTELKQLQSRMRQAEENDLASPDVISFLSTIGNFLNRVPQEYGGTRTAAAPPVDAPEVVPGGSNTRSIDGGDAQQPIVYNANTSKEDLKLTPAEGASNSEVQGINEYNGFIDEEKWQEAGDILQNVVAGLDERIIQTQVPDGLLAEIRRRQREAQGSDRQAQGGEINVRNLLTPEDIQGLSEDEINNLVEQILEEVESLNSQYNESKEYSNTGISALYETVYLTEELNSEQATQFQVYLKNLKLLQDKYTGNATARIEEILQGKDDFIDTQIQAGQTYRATPTPARTSNEDVQRLVDRFIGFNRRETLERILDGLNSSNQGTEENAMYVVNTFVGEYGKGVEGIRLIPLRADYAQVMIKAAEIAEIPLEDIGFENGNGQPSGPQDWPWKDDEAWKGEFKDEDWPEENTEEGDFIKGTDSFEPGEYFSRLRWKINKQTKDLVTQEIFAEITEGQNRVGTDVNWIGMDIDNWKNTQLDGTRIKDEDDETVGEVEDLPNLAQVYPTQTATSSVSEEQAEEELRQFVRDNMETIIPPQFRTQATEQQIREALIRKAADEGYASKFTDPNKFSQIIEDELQKAQAETTTDTEVGDRPDYMGWRLKDSVTTNREAYQAILNRLQQDGETMNADEIEELWNALEGKVEQVQQ